MHTEELSEELIKEASEYTEKLSSTQKGDELSLYKKWMKTGKKEYFQDLYSSMKPLIVSAANKAAYNSNIPQAAHMAYAAQNFHDALRTYDPSKGALQTHVYGAVHQKAKRLNYLYQDLGHKPEPRAQMVGLYQTEKEFLKAELGREPSQAEMADRMGINLGEVANIEREVRKDLALDEGTENNAYFMTDKEVEKLDFIYYDLMGEEQVVYDYILGAHGKPKLMKQNNKVDFEGIARAMGVSPSKVRNIFKRIQGKFEKVAL